MTKPRIRFETIRDMRNAIFAGQSFEDYYASNNGAVFMPSLENARIAWEKALTMADDNDAWQAFLVFNLQKTFASFADRLDQYWNDGFGTDLLEETLGISQQTIADIITQLEDTPYGDR